MEPAPWYVPDPRFAIACLVIALFGWALSANPGDDTMKGALIAGFAGAWGFYLGSAKVNQEAREQQGRLIDVVEKQSDSAIIAAATAAAVAAGGDPSAEPALTVEHADSVDVSGAKPKAKGKP